MAAQGNSNAGTEMSGICENCNPRRAAPRRRLLRLCRRLRLLVDQPRRETLNVRVCQYDTVSIHETVDQYSRLSSQASDVLVVGHSHRPNIGNVK